MRENQHRYAVRRFNYCDVRSSDVMALRDATPGVAEQFANRSVAISVVRGHAGERSPQIMRPCICEPGGVEDCGDRLLEIRTPPAGSVRKYKIVVGGDILAAFDPERPDQLERRLADRPG